MCHWLGEFRATNAQGHQAARQIRKDVPSAEHVAEETSLLVGCRGHQLGKKMGFWTKENTLFILN